MDATTAMLVKAAADTAGVMARMARTAELEKEAAPLSWLARQGGRMFGRSPAIPRVASPLPQPGMLPKPPAPPAAGTAGAFGFNPRAHASAVNQQVRPPAAAAPRPRMSPLSRLGIAGGTLGAGGLGAAHMNAAAEDTVGSTSNPFTWANPKSEQQVFDQNLSRAKSMQGSHEAAITKAIAGGNFDEAARLQAELEGGEFGGSSGLARFFNPFASRSGKTYADRARAVQQADKGKIDQSQGHLNRWGSRMTGTQKGDIESQIAALRSRMSTAVPFGEAVDTPKPTASGNWAAVGNRPRLPPGIQGMLFNPNDYRRGDAWEAQIAEAGGARPRI